MRAAEAKLAFSWFPFVVTESTLQIGATLTDNHVHFVQKGPYYWLCHELQQRERGDSLTTRAVHVATALAQPLGVVHALRFATPHFPVCQVVGETVINGGGVDW